jgi:hypothetical protein
MAVMDLLPISSSAAPPAAPPEQAAPAQPVDARALKQRYKEAKRAMGVYAIRNLVDGRILLGASPDVDGALNRHRFELDHKGHRDRELLRDWLRLGPQGFRFEIVDTVKLRDDPAFDAEAELAALLALWIEELDPAGTGYRPRRPGATPAVPEGSA